VDRLRRATKLGLAALSLGATLMAATPAFAQADEAAVDMVDRALDRTRMREYDKALELLADAQVVCLQEGCDPSVKADIYLAQGIAEGLNGKLDVAQTRFEWALAENDSAVPDERYTTRAVRDAYDAAKATVDEGNGAEPPKPPGELSDEQKQSLETARKQLDGRDWEGCLQTMLISTSIEEYAAGKLMLARCQDNGGLLLEARRDADAALERAKKDGNRALIKELEEYLVDLDSETPKIRLTIQSGIRDPVVKIDNTEVPADAVKQPIPHNPGTALVEVTGKRGGQPYEFSQEIRFQRRETIDLEVRSDVTPYQACLNKARTLSEKQECDRIFNKKEGLNVKTGLEVASYNDTNEVGVVTPSLFFGAVQPTDGWNVGASVLVDVVTAASADIVATASRRWDEARFGASASGGYKIGPVTPSLNASVSVEPDYIGRNVGTLVTVDLLDKMLSPYAGYSFGFDILGRADTPFSTFHRDIYNHTISAGTGIVFDASTVGVASVTANFEDGNTSKPYRHVAMFAGDVVDDLPKGASPELIAAARQPPAPLERLPDTRQRYAALARIAHRMDTLTIRASERFYIDSWGQMASSTDARLYWDFWSLDDEDGNVGFPALTMSPHLRFHFQGPVDFWQRAYTVAPTLNGYLYPKYFTGDRELGPLFTVTVGNGVRGQLTEVLAIGVQVEGLYTQFLDHLLLVDRWGLFTASTLELEFD
jgi:tetratricopeptide (TPR) repeat protein